VTRSSDGALEGDATGVAPAAASAVSGLAAGFGVSMLDVIPGLDGFAAGSETRGASTRAGAAVFCAAAVGAAAFAARELLADTGAAAPGAGAGTAAGAGARERRPTESAASEGGDELATISTVATTAQVNASASARGVNTHGKITFPPGAPFERVARRGDFALATCSDILRREIFFSLRSALSR
jgi:hypothetical protein